jgi:hypothetical protein
MKRLQLPEPVIVATLEEDGTRAVAGEFHWREGELAPGLNRCGDGHRDIVHEPIGPNHGASVSRKGARTPTTPPLARGAVRALPSPATRAPNVTLCAAAYEVHTASTSSSRSRGTESALLAVPPVRGLH